MADNALTNQSGRLTELKTSTVTIYFDAVLSRSHNFQTTITTSPVEDGTTISDHAVLEPEMLSLEGMVTDDPIEALPGEVLPADDDPIPLVTRSRKAADELYKVWQSREEVTITTRSHEYKNMMIESLSWEETFDLGQALIFSISFKQLIKAQLVTVIVENLRETEKDLAAGKVQRGKRKSKEATPTVIKSMNDQLGRLGLAK